MIVSILQWNIWYKEDIRNIAKFLKEVNADLVCLQELTINSPDQPEKDTVVFIAKELGFEFVHKEITFENDDIKLANAIFSRFPINSKRTEWINEPTGTGHYDDEYRAYVEADIEINDKVLKVGTVHMSYTNAFEITDRKREENKKLLEAVANNDENFILTGDFNAKPDSEVINQISTKLKNVGPNYSIKSWTTKPFSYDGFEANTLDWRLDYIFATPDIKATSSEILSTEFSDHLPLLAKVEI